MIKMLNSMSFKVISKLWERNKPNCKSQFTINFPLKRADSMIPTQKPDHLQMNHSFVYWIKCFAEKFWLKRIVCSHIRHRLQMLVNSLIKQFWLDWFVNIPKFFMFLTQIYGLSLKDFEYSAQVMANIFYWIFMILVHPLWSLKASVATIPQNFSGYVSWKNESNETKQNVSLFYSIYFKFGIWSANAFEFVWICTTGNIYN